MHNLHVPHVPEQTREAGRTIVDEIMQLEDELKQREAAFAKVQAEFHHSICSSKARLGPLYNAENPLLQLPTEILSRIMEQALEPSERVEITLSHVCRRLRHIALSTPSLRADVIAPEWSEPMMEAYITRSGAYPLNIDLTVEVAVEYEGNLGYVGRTVSILSSCVLRWRSFKLLYDDWRTHPLLPHGPAHPLPFLQHIASTPSLQYLELHILRTVPGHLQSVPDVRYMLFNQGVPNLTKVVFWTDDFRLLCLLPPLDNVVSLAVGSLRQRDEWHDDAAEGPIPILRLLSHHKLRQLALREAKPIFNYRHIHFDLTIPSRIPPLPIDYTRLRSLRIPLQVIPSLLTFPREIFEEISHLFVDIGRTSYQFPEDLDNIDNALAIGLLPKLDYFTLYTAPDEDTHSVTINGEGKLFLNLTNTITHFAVLGDDEYHVRDWFFETRPDHWPRLEVAHFGQPGTDGYLEKDTLRWAIERRGFNPSFFVEVPLARSYLEHLSQLEDVQEDLQTALEMGVFHEVDSGPTIPVADVEWLYV